MGKFVIKGGKKLNGSIQPQGAKNEALQVICACLLTSEEIKISNIPEIIDVLNLIEILKKIGVKVEKNQTIRIPSRLIILTWTNCQTLNFLGWELD